MSHWFRKIFWMVAVLSFSLLLAACETGQARQDSSDQAELRRIFNIPEGAELKSYDGYPVMVGFGQREGLHLSAVYTLNNQQQAGFVQHAADNDWQPLPVPAKIRKDIPWKDLPVPLDAASGYFLCRTAGDDVLHATRTESCAVKLPELDIILGIYDDRTHELSVVVRSGY